MFSHGLTDRFAAWAAAVEAAEAVGNASDAGIWATMKNSGMRFTARIAEWCVFLPKFIAAKMHEPHVCLIGAAVLGTIALCLLMPGKKRRTTVWWGGVLGGLAVVCLLSLVPAAAPSMELVTFTALAALTVTAGTATVVSKSPIYCAVWFAVTLLGVGGLMLLNGAQFLGVATVAVYAGAIVVMFLFVLMLAQPQGHTRYDRVGWGRTAKWLGCAAGAISTCLLVWALLATPAVGVPADGNPVLTENHVANLGGQLFSRRLLEVQVAGLLMFAALVGCVAIASAKAIRVRGSGRQLQENAFDSDHNLTGGIVRHD